MSARAGQVRLAELLQSLLAALAVALLAGCGSGTTGSPGASVDGVAGPSDTATLVDSMASIELSNHASAEIQRGGGYVIVVDGLARGTSGFEMRAWVAPEGDLADVREIDLGALGPRTEVSVRWWNDAFHVLGIECPTGAAYDGADPVTIEMRCGSTTWSLVAVDPATGDVHGVGDDIVRGPDEYMSIQGATDDEMYVWFGGDDRTIRSDGEIVDIDEPPRVSAGPDRSTVVCAIGDRFFAVGPTEQVTGEDGRAAVDGFYTLHVLDDTRWVEQAMPRSQVTTASSYPAPGYDGGCSDHGFAAVTTDVVQNGVRRAAPHLGIELLAPATGGGLVWVTLPADESGEGVESVEVVNGRILRSVTPAVTAGDQAKTTVQLWTGDEWNVLSNALGRDSQRDRLSPDEAVILRDGTIVHLGDLPPWTGPITHTAAGIRVDRP